ncbi:hypothetical protein [Phenylobacterium sp.]|jgi:hypothetical protein|uniref:hypothetical protein n=1 Tax=Phenylobacterium sp. TaxID=1871053 RepID=UPI002E30101A|nr:hypothetical protein [Phenylobacterium sp.]HEX2558793.1 hypothetical protein [Phenylobacterium sp.]
MDGREEQIAREAEALWREVFGEPPAVQADGATLLDIIMRSTEPKSYERLNRPYLRDAGLVFPKRAETRL